jgi:hypothetical protein
MTCNSRLLLALSLMAAAAGCGNYSNEDLEFMNALPETGDLQANLPARSSALEPASEAELARLTHNTTNSFNRLLDDLTGIVDTIRTSSPTSRTPDSRTWGPFPADRSKGVNLDWKTRMIMTRDLTVKDQFDYEIDVHKDGSSELEWLVFIRGTFMSGLTARRGMGHVELVTADVRAAGLDVSDLGVLDSLVIDYRRLPILTTVDMTITDLPAAGSTDAPMVLFHYKQTATGRGQMIFDLIGNLVTTGPAIEDVQVTSNWLPTGEGLAQLRVLSGDGVGLQQAECWDTSFDATFNVKPWAPMEQVAPTGDQASLCPDIPAF